MITADDLRSLADYLVDQHGKEKAVDYADTAVREFEEQGETVRANAWKALRSVVKDIVDGRLDSKETIVLQ